MLTAKFLPPLVILAVILSCASTPPAGRETPLTSNPQVESQMKELEASKRVGEMNGQLLMRVLSSRQESERDYKIGPEDLIEISVFEDEKLNRTVRVSSEGNVSLPLLGPVMVKGLTSNQLEKEIRDLLMEKYFQDPHVSVFIKEFHSQQVSVIGAVDKPGVYSFMGHKTVLDALAMAGGLTGKGDDAAGQLLFLIRPLDREEEQTNKEKEPNDNKNPRTFLIDLEDLLVKGDLTLNLPLQHGDIINVPVSGKIFVGGEVRSPGGFQLRGKKVTVTQAVAMAGGLNPKAAGAETRIFRYSEKSSGKEVLTADVYAIQKGNKEDIYLKENDIVIVPKSGTKTVLSEIWELIKGKAYVGFTGGL